MQAPQRDAGEHGVHIGRQRQYDVGHDQHGEAEREDRAAIGAIADGGDGAAKGAAIGAVASGLKKGEAVVLKPGVVLEFKLQQPLTVNR